MRTLFQCIPTPTSSLILWFSRIAADVAFSCNIDSTSHAEVVYAVENLSSSIEDFVCNLIDTILGSGLSLRPSHLMAPEPATVLACPLQCLTDSTLPDQLRTVVVENVLRDLLCKTIHKHYFRGKHFFGVGSEPHSLFLETLLTKLATCGKNFPPPLFFSSSF